MAESEKDREDFFCRKCACHFANRHDFFEHKLKHLDDAESHFMKHIETYICSYCSKTFEVQSDLILHNSTVCFPPYTCKHCLEECKNSTNLQIHLFCVHKYTEEMLRNEGFVIDLENPMLKCLITKKFDNLSEIVSKTLDKLFKTLICETCKEYFSTKCILDKHLQTHIMEQMEMPRNYLAAWKMCRYLEDRNNASEIKQTISSAGSSETDDHGSEIRQKISSAGSSEASDFSDSPRTLLQPSHIVLGSSIWKPISRFQSVRSSISTRNAMLKSKKIEISEAANQNYSSHQISVLKSSNLARNSSKWMRIKLKTKLRDLTALDERKSTGKINLQKKIKSGKMKLRKKKPKYENKANICDLCKRRFTDGYKLRRHRFIHTGERPYTCTKCKKTFARDDHLKRHFMRVCYKN